MDQCSLIELFRQASGIEMQENCKVCGSPKMGTGSVDRWTLQWRLVVPTVPVPFFGRRRWVPWKKGTGTEPQGISSEVDADPGSEPVPIFHSGHQETERNGNSTVGSAHPTEL